MATLAHNLGVRRTALLDSGLVTRVDWLGDAAHQAECSDHNPDATGVVHAIDAMTLDTDSQDQIVAWALGDTADLEYVINRRRIWERSHGFAEMPYDGLNPHTDHVHISGRHGTAGRNTATCTGYSRSAEALTPEGLDIMTAAQLATLVAEIRALPAAISLAIVQQPVDAHGVTVGLAVEKIVDIISPTVLVTAAAIQSGNATLATIEANTTPVAPTP